MSEKKKGSFRPLAFFKRKQFRIGWYAILATLLFIAVVILVNVGVKAAEDNWALRLDLSYNSLTKFSDSTTAALKELDEDVHFYVLAAQGAENASVMEILDRYRAASNHISVSVIDPDKNPGVITKFRTVDSAAFGSNTVIVTNGDESRYKVYSYYDLVTISYNETYQQNYISAYNYEKMFTQGMLYVTAEKTPTVYVLQGHGEVPFSSLTAMETLLTSNNYDVKELGLTDEMPTGNSDILFVLSPSKDLTAEERDKIMAFLENGGNMLYLCDVTAPSNLANFNTLLSYYGVGFEEGMVVANLNDSAQYYPMQPTFLLPALGTHDITTPLTEGGQNIIIVPQTRAIKMPDMERNDFTTTQLLTSKSGSYLIDVSDTTRTTVEKKAGDKEGPFPLAASVQRLNFADSTKESRVLLMGSINLIAADQMLNSFNNGEFLISSVKWATKDEAINLSIYSKTAQRQSLKISSANEFYTLGVLVVVIIPALVLIAGIIVWVRRRHL